MATAIRYFLICFPRCSRALDVLKVQMLDGLFRFWRGRADRADYFVTLARLRVLDWLARPEPETPADQQRERERQQIKKAFPKIEL